MHDPEGRPRLRWRMLLWPILGVILLPVMYVAASGPLWWWFYHSSHEPGWHVTYEQSLAPLYSSPEFASMMPVYRAWWEGVPAPRSWKRAKIVAEIKSFKKEVEDASVAEQQWREQTTRVETAMKRLRTLLNQPETQPGRAEEIAQLKAAMEKEQQLAGACQPVSIGQRRAFFEAALVAAEQKLRELDAQ